MSAWWQSPWLPWNYPKDLSSSFMQQLENGLLYIFSMILQAFLSVLSSVFALIMDAFQSVVTFLVQVSESLGPFSLPVFVIGTAVMICTGYLAFALAKDTPVVGGFV
ncbi:hypothetical protein ApAK_08815 [Thermoplasmatales archaeon AK]|nr:hypothetical protein [Thermoplasmatales archaeon AK]